MIYKLFLGPPARPAYLNNTLTINGENHNSRLGGGIVNQNKNVKDYIIESPGEKVERFEDIECKSKFLFFRKSFNEIDNVFVKSSTKFFLYKNGFQSDTPVTLFFKDSKGVIISNGAKLKLTGEVANLNNSQNK